MTGEEADGEEADGRGSRREGTRGQAGAFFFPKWVRSTINRDHRAKPLEFFPSPAQTHTLTRVAQVEAANLSPPPSEGASLMATVLIWNNNMFGSGHHYTGHAAMNITDHWAQYGSANSDNYVSWIPADNKKRWLVRSGQDNPTFVKDLEFEEGYVPDHIIRLNLLSSSQMDSCWKNIRQNSGKYHMTGQNCSDMVAKVLKAGAEGGAYKGKYSLRHHLIWTPLKVKRLALDYMGKYGGNLMSWDDLLGELRRDNAISQDEKVAMASMRKRDDRHGSSGAESYFADGARLAQKHQVTLSVVGGKAMARV